MRYIINKLDVKTACKTCANIRSLSSRVSAILSELEGPVPPPLLDEADWETDGSVQLINVE